MSTQKKIILVVDDEPGLCEMFQDYFEEQGYDVRIALDGAQAVTVLAQVPAKPCIIICDLLMPIMGGEELYREVSADPVLHSIPFLFMSTDPARAPAGALFMKKPLDLDVLRDSVRKCCDGSVGAVS